jgi:hypothetical protein
VKDGLADDVSSYPHSGGMFFDGPQPDGAEATVPTSANTTSIPLRRHP